MVFSHQELFLELIELLFHLPDHLLGFLMYNFKVLQIDVDMLDLMALVLGLPALFTYLLLAALAVEIESLQMFEAELLFLL